jgi:hypothetical protein
MSTLVAEEGGRGCQLFCKGASEIVLTLCTHYVTENLTIAPMDEVSA